MIEPLLVVQCIVSPSLFIFFHDLLRGCIWEWGIPSKSNLIGKMMIKQQDLGYPATRLPSSQTNLCLPELGQVNFGILWATVAFICFQSAILPFSHRPPELSNQRMARALRTAAAPQMSPKYHSFGCIHTSQWKNMFLKKTCYHILSLCLST